MKANVRELVKTLKKSLTEDTVVEKSVGCSIFITKEDYNKLCKLVDAIEWELNHGS